MIYKGYEIAASKGHGKAVAGTKRTSTIQIRKPCLTGYYLKGQVRFIVGDIEGRRRAVQKAKDKVDKLIIEGKG